MKDCSTCHYDNIADARCFDGVGCFDNPEHPNWEPKTNYDRIADMSEDDLVKLWAVTEFDEKYIADCYCGDGKGHCTYPDFDCKACPETFRNWLRSTADET